MTRQYNKAYLDGGVTVKRCGMCDKVFPLDQFGNRGKWGKCAYCKLCTLDLAKKSKRKTRDEGRKVEYQPRFKNSVYINNGVPYKKCNKCGTDYPHTFEYFDTNKKGQGGLQSKCRNCRQDYNHDYAESHWYHGLVRNASKAAQIKHLDFDIDEEYIEDLYKFQKGKCYWTGVTLVPSKKQKYPLQPSIDRLDCNKGYIRGNVVLCCFVANMGRNNNSVEEFKEFLIKLKEDMEFSQWQS